MSDPLPLFVTPLTFRVVGLPAPKGSMRAFVVRGKFGTRAVTTEKNPGVRPWVALVADAALQAGARQLERGGVLVGLRFLMPRPSSLPRRIRYPDRKPDLDKLTRAVLDALTGVCWRDDGQVVGFLFLEKVYAAPAQPPGVMVEVRPAV